MSERRQTFARSGASASGDRPIEIAPSILSADFAHLGDEIARVEEAGADLLHVDVMDGHFVPNLTIGLPVLRAIRRVTELPLDVHLMISNAEAYLGDYVDAGADLIGLHQEACTHLHRAVHRVRELGASPGVVLNPATAVETLRPIIGELDFVLLMTVNPGFGGQRFIEGSLRKIAGLRQLCAQEGASPVIEVDGGVSPDNIERIAEAGASRFVAGNAVFSAESYTSRIAGLRQRAEGGARLRRQKSA
ncbi:MAG: ribulose-phosphate 3-epimerase [Myxococcales bacterium]|nr:ribulose-phosphate 3-epimerase [Myxococcales bacterium]